MNHLLLVEDDKALAALLTHRFKAAGFAVTACQSLSDAELAVHQHTPLTHCLLDLNLAHHNGLRLLPSLKHTHPACKTVILSGYASIATTVQAVKEGAVNVLPKPSRFEQILAAFEPQDSPEPLQAQGLDRHAQESIQRALTQNAFNITKTAQQLGMHRRTLQRKLKKHGL